MQHIYTYNWNFIICLFCERFNISEGDRKYFLYRNSQRIFLHILFSSLNSLFRFTTIIVPVCKKFSWLDSAWYMCHWKCNTTTPFSHFILLQVSLMSQLPLALIPSTRILASLSSHNTNAAPSVSGRQGRSYRPQRRLFAVYLHILHGIYQAWIDICHDI